MMTLTHPGTIWSQRHADTLNALDHVTFAPMAMFGGLSPTQAASSSAATTSSNGSATAAWNAAIEAKMTAHKVTKQQAVVLVVKENPKLQADYIEEFRQQAALR